MPANRDRLIFRFFRLFEGEAEVICNIGAGNTCAGPAFVVCIAFRGIR